MRVAAVWRYPVKSFLGEELDAVTVDARGLAGDRRFAVVDARGKFGSGKTTRRFRLIRGLFAYTARTSGAAVVVATPDGRELAVGDPALDAELSGRYGEPLRVLPEADVSHFDAGPVHVLTTASLRWVAERLGSGAADPRRFRPNLLLEADGDGLLEDAWIGRVLEAGDLRLRILGRTVRCGMPHFPQSELPASREILRRLVQENGQCLGVYAEVVQGGAVSAGDGAALA